MPRARVTRSAVAETEREWQQLTRDKSVDIVRTHADWKRLLKSPHSPLKQVDERAVATFTSPSSSGTAGSPAPTMA
jgi:hypothetical protein